MIRLSISFFSINKFIFVYLFLKRKQTEHVYLWLELFSENHVTSEREYRSTKIAEEVGGPFR